MVPAAMVSLWGGGAGEQVWDITTEGNLDINQRVPIHRALARLFVSSAHSRRLRGDAQIVPFYQLHGVIIIVDGAAVDQDQGNIIRDILQRILNTPPACQSRCGVALTPKQY